MPDQNAERTVTYDPLHAFVSKFENVRVTDTSVNAFEGLSVEQKIKKHLIDGIKKGLEGRLDEALASYTPLQIINDILLDAMKEVGELFGAGKMQLPFVLQSAEVMKASVRYLEPMMDKVEGSEKGSILLATVSGDVHDIGKNLVDIILSNNGFRVVNIGIKQPISSILERAAEHNCQVIGMSGLLVKSTIIMRDNLLVMNERNVANYPVLVGGAALTRSYVEKDLSAAYDGQVFYAQDAFEGLRLMNELAAGGYQTDSIAEKGTESIQSVAALAPKEVDPALYVFDGVTSQQPPATAPKLPFYGSRTASDVDIETVYNYINPIALFRGQWQYRKEAGMGNPEFNEWLETNVQPIFERKKEELKKVLKPAVKWGYFWCRSEGNDLIILEEDARAERLRFNFPRQRDGKRLCISDFFGSAEPDVVGFQIVTVGREVSELEREQFQNGDYHDYLLTHGMGVESAEGLAEYWHLQMRKELGIADQEPDELRLLFSAKYHGARYSFGYPACPNLEDQVKLFELLQPQDIGIELSEGFMLVPEQSTSALIVHHPAAQYFNVK